MAGWIILMLSHASETWRDAEVLRSDSVLLARALDQIGTSASPGSIVDVAIDPLDPNTHELAAAIPYQLAWRGRADLATQLLVVPGPDSDPRAAAQAGVQLADRY